MFLFRMLALLLVAPVLLADSNSNAINERIPVRKAEMEVHWNVNCVHSWARVEELRGKPGAGECVFPSDLQRQLQLCAFIYQPPGEESSHSGPDFQAAINKECPL